MKDTDTNKSNVLEDHVLNDPNAEADEVIKAADRKKDKSPDVHGEELRIWHCQGVAIGLHIHKKMP
jgi:hypothetical protein